MGPKIYDSPISEEKNLNNDLDQSESRQKPTAKWFVFYAYCRQGVLASTSVWLCFVFNFCLKYFKMVLSYGPNLKSKFILFLIAERPNVAADILKVILHK